jgi:murein DD-endopeptidase MepM/ murein hydrolase activator NlpD
MLNQVLGVSFLSFILFVSGCARHKVPFERPSPHPDNKGVYHVVERHQTLYRICKTYRVDLKEVASINGISDPSQIQTGQRIFIPKAKKVLKVEIYIDDVAAEQGGRMKVADKKLDFIWPVEGKVSDFFEDAERIRHQGIDISSPAGTPIRASNAGRIIYSDHTIRGYGNLIILRHSEEFVSVYAHNQENLVEEGRYVEKGQVIAKVGETGNASGPHLHFEIRRHNKAVDPLLFLK